MEIYVKKSAPISSVRISAILYLSSAFATAAAIVLILQVRHTTLAALHKCLEFGLKGILFLFGCGLARTLRCCGRLGRLLLFHSFFDGKVDTAGIVNTDDLDLHLISLVQMLTDIIHIGIGDFRNVNQTGFALRQGDERAKFSNTGNLSLYDRTNTELHNEPKYPP